MAKRPNHVLRQLMTEYGLTAGGLADAVNDQIEQRTGQYGNATDRHVRRWLAGEVRRPWPCHLEPLCNIFGRGPAELGFLVRSKTTAASPPSPSRLLEEQATQQESPVRRRNFFLAATGAVVHVAALPLPSTGRIGLTDVQKIHAALNDLHKLDDQHGGGDLAAVAERYIAHVQDAMHRCIYGGNAERGLYGALGELSASAGWFAFDAGQQARARGHFNAALRAALLADDKGLQARIWSYIARQAWELGKGNEAVTVSRAALSATRPVRNPRLSALLHARTAMGHALLGEAGACSRSLLDAERVFDRVADTATPAWLAFCGPDELTGLTAMSLHRLGRYTQAVESGVDAVNLTPARFQRNKVGRLAHLAKYQLAQGEVDQATGTARSAMDQLGSLRSPRCEKRLLQFRQSVGTIDTSEAKQFVHQFDEVAKARSAADND